MNTFSSIPLLIALTASASISLAQSPAAGGASSSKGPALTGSVPATGPGSTGGTHSPNTSASGEAIKCPPAMARSIESASGSAGTGSSSGPSRPRDIATQGDCTAVGASGTSGSKGDSRAPDSVSERTGITDKTDPFKGQNQKQADDKGK
jgi:hypothetical protein